MLEGKNVVILDLETEKSADDCRHCGRTVERHQNLTQDWEGDVPPVLHCQEDGGARVYARLGWDNKAALGLSIGCYWDYRDSRINWFDVSTLEETIRHFVETQPLLVSFHGIGFDFPVMEGVLRQAGDTWLASAPESEEGSRAHRYADRFRSLAASSYDILTEIWHQHWDVRPPKGTCMLDAIAQANGYGAKLRHGAQAPRDWRDGRHAKVLNYCQDDVYVAKALFEQILTTGQILRGDGAPLALPIPLAVCREEQ